MATVNCDGWFSRVAAPIITAIEDDIINSPKVILSGIEGCHPRRSKATHSQAKNGASTKIASALID